MKKLNNKIIPVIYYDIIKDKKVILKENNGKSGVYRWVNNINKKSYIGSSINLTKRFYCYFSPGFLRKQLLRNRSFIYSAILKYGYNKFKLEILEYCTKENVLNREQYYIDIIRPEYNICKVAGSRLRLKHTLAAKKAISNAWKIHKSLG